MRRIPSLVVEESREDAKVPKDVQLLNQNLAERPFSSLCLMRGKTMSLSFSSLLARHEKDTLALVVQ